MFVFRPGLLSSLRLRRGFYATCVALCLAGGSVAPGSAQSLQRDAELFSLFALRSMTDVNTYHFGQVTGTNAKSKAWGEQIDRAQTFRRADPSPAIDVFTSLVPPPQRSAMAKSARLYLEQYRSFVERLGYPSNYVSTAILITTVSAYYEIRGEGFADSAYAPKVWFGLSAAMAQASPIRNWSDEQKQRYADATAILGVGFISACEEARRKHDRAALKRLHDDARDYVRIVWNVDMDRTPLDAFVCMTDVSKNSSCDRYKWIITGGRVGQPFEEIVRALRSRLASGLP